jgi:hypothetical protein
MSKVPVTYVCHYVPAIFRDCTVVEVINSVTSHHILQDDYQISLFRVLLSTALYLLTHAQNYARPPFAIAFDLQAIAIHGVLLLVDLPFGGRIQVKLQVNPLTYLNLNYIPN